MANKPLAGKSMAVAKRDTLQGLLESMKGRMQSVLPKHITAERMMRVALVAASKNPKLYDCTKESVAKAMMDASELGLEPGGARQLAALIPYKTECQFQPMYKGLIELALRDGRVVSIEADVVHEKDHFKDRRGTNALLEHEPYLGADAGKTIAAYAIATLANGMKQWVTVPRRELDQIQNSSKDKRPDSAWRLWPDPMRCKTAIKRLCKFIPCSPELAKAIALDNANDGAIDTEFEIVPDAAAIENKLAAGTHKAHAKTKPGRPKKKEPTHELSDAVPPTQEPESQPTTHEFERGPSEEEICAFLESDKTTDVERESFKRRCEGVGTSAATWLKATDAQIESLLNTVRDLINAR